MFLLLAALAFAGEPPAPIPGQAEFDLGWAKYDAHDFAGAITLWADLKKGHPDFPEIDMWIGSATFREKLTHVEIGTPDVPTVADGGSITFAAAGDTMMGSDRVKGDAGLSPDDGRSLFVDTRAIFSAADIGFLNLEGPLADGLPSTKCAPGSTDCHAFRTPTRYVAALTDAGIDAAQLSNNHAMDLGAAGLESSMKALDDAKIAHTGRYGDIGYVERDGKRIAFVGGHSGSCCLDVNDVEQAKRAVAYADQNADIVVFVFHGGAEGGAARHVEGKTEIAWGEARGNVKALARGVVDAGADLVLGNGPHVLRAMEVYKGRLIAYSLGNYTGYRQFGTGGGYGGTSVILNVELAGNGVLKSASLTSLSLNSESVPSIDPTGAGAAQIADLSKSDFPDTGVAVAADGTLSWR